MDEIRSKNNVGYRCTYHVHLLVTVDPQHGIHRLVKQIKSRSSRLLRQQFPTLRTRLPTL